MSKLSIKQILIIFLMTVGSINILASDVMDCKRLTSQGLTEATAKLLKDNPMAVSKCGAFFELDENQDAMIVRKQKVFQGGYTTNVERQTTVTRTGKHFYWPDVYEVTIYSNDYSDTDFNNILKDGESFYKRLNNLRPIRKLIKTEDDIWNFLRRVGVYLKKMGVTDDPIFPKEIVIKSLDEVSAAVIPIGNGWHRMEVNTEDFENDLSNHLMYLHLTHELIHLQKITDESATDLIALAILAEMANDGDKDCEMAIMDRLIDYVLYAPFFMVIYNDSLPSVYLDLTIKALHQESLAGPDYAESGGPIEIKEDFYSVSYQAINKKLSEQRDNGALDRWMDWKIQLGIVKPSDRDENLKHMIKLSKKSDFKFAVMAYGLLPYSTINRISTMGKMPSDVFPYGIDVINDISVKSLQKLIINSRLYIKK